MENCRNEPCHEKNNKMTFATSEDSDQPGRINLRFPHEETMSPQLHIERTAKTDQTGWMPRLIRVFAGHTDNFVGFVVRWLIFLCHEYQPSLFPCLPLFALV